METSVPKVQQKVHGKIHGHVEELICELHAQGLTPASIHKELAKKEISIARTNVWAWINNPKHTPKLQQAIQKYRSNPLAVDMAHKRIRLEDMNRERKSLILTLAKFKNEDGSVKDKKFYYRYIQARFP